MLKRSLALRMLIALIIVFGLGFCSLVLYLYDSRDELRRTVMFIQAREIAAGFTSQSDPASLPTSFAGGELSYTLYSPEKKVVWKSDNLDRPRRLRLATLEDEYRLFRKPLDSGYVINVPVALADGSVLMVAKRDAFEREIIGSLLHTRMLRGLMIQALFCLIAAALIIGLLHWMMRPIRKAAWLTEAAGTANPDYRIPLDTLPREILPLARAANNGLDRLAHAYTLEKRFFEDAAHELRTPLAVLDLRLQRAKFADEADRQAVACDLVHMRRLLSQLMTLSRQEQIDTSSPLSDVNLSRVTREAVAALLSLFEEQSRRLQANIEDSVRVRGDAHSLRRAITNLLDNALLHGSGDVVLTLAREPDGRCTLEVSDEGEGIPLATQEDMFLRFRKGRSSTSGSGLGLAITRNTLHSYGASIQFVSQSPCVVRVTFTSSEFDQQARA